MNLLGLVSHSIGAAAYLFLSVLLLTAWRGRLQGGLLVGVCLISVVWCAVLAVDASTGMIPVHVVSLLEVGRDLGWFVFGFSILRYAKGTDERGLAKHVVEWASYALCFALLVSLIVTWTAETVRAIDATGGRTVLGFLAISIVGWALVEQIYRNTRHEHRWAVKFLCLGIGALFAYDFVLYAGAVLVGTVGGDLWNARGLVQAMVVPLIAVSASRNPQWSLEVFVSRHVVFHTATVLGAGGYLLAMAVLGYYIREVGGSWGGVAQITFLCGAAVLLLLIFSSAGVRARSKVFIAKHFFKNRYDYREEWLRFTQALSSGDTESTLQENVIRATCAIVDSPGGSLWMRRGAKRLERVAAWHSKTPEAVEISCEDSLVSFLEKSGWVIYLDECRLNPDKYDGIALPDFLANDHDAWVIVPLPLGDALIGFISLDRSSTYSSPNWEDTDLFRVVGQQSASFLALYDKTQELAEARQFEAFNRLSSYVVHDLKNLVAQLSLVSQNAEKHINNPDFVSDAMGTVQNATARMNRLLAQLRKGDLGETSTKMVNLKLLLEKLVTLRSADRPAPTLHCEETGLVLQTDPERLGAVLEHLVQNAQEATPDTGQVRVAAKSSTDGLQIEVKDTGSGMDADFIRQRLFKPFDTTKGNAGMGIGVFEAREFVNAQGGSIDVDSQPGKGTVFRIKFPAEPNPFVVESLTVETHN